MLPLALASASAPMIAPTLIFCRDDYIPSIDAIARIKAEFERLRAERLALHDHGCCEGMWTHSLDCTNSTDPWAELEDETASEPLTMSEPLTKEEREMLTKEERERIQATPPYGSRWDLMRYETTCAAQEAEVERLKAALDRIRQLPYGGINLHVAIAIARAALLAHKTTWGK